MEYILYFLQFDTPVHFGCGEEGGKLEKSTLRYRADTLFSALCCEMAAVGDVDGLVSVYEKASRGHLLFSDLFPYVKKDDEPHLFLPKPILTIERNEKEPAASYQQFKTKATQQKSLKKMEYVRVSESVDYLKSLGSGYYGDWERPDTGQSQMVTRVHSSTGADPLPYYVHEITLSNEAGLYGILGYDEEDGDWILALLEQMGVSGIGGKRSSGYGKFHFDDDPIYMDQDGCYTDDAVLYALLTADDATYYMNLSVLLPQAEDLPVVQEGQYTLCKRSGFLTPEGMKAAKKEDIYMIQAGSCFSRKITGQIADVSSGSLHPVWRYGKGLYVGLSL